MIAVDLTVDRQRLGAARLLGVKPHTLALWLIQNGGQLDEDLLPRLWLEHAVVVLERVQVEHGITSMGEVFGLLADEPAEAPRERRRSRR